MPVPSSISDLSTTPSLNSPAGTESPSTVDDYLRTFAAFIKQVDGGAVKAADLAATGGSALVGYDSGTAQDVLDEAKPIANYTALRAYTGRATGVRITQAGLAGFFQRDSSDTTSADNGGTIIVDASDRRWKRLFDASVNVKWFGAKGDAVTDDTAALQAALDSLPSVGGEVRVPAGQYRITAGLVANKRVRLVGAGYSYLLSSPSPCVIIKASTVTGPGLMLPAPASTVENLSFLGEVGNTGDGILIRSSRCTLRDVSVFQMGQDGIRIGTDDGNENCNIWHLSNVKTKSNGRHGLHLSEGAGPLADTNAGTCINIDAQSNNNAGVYLNGSQLNTFVGGAYQNNGTFGIHLSQHASYNVFSGGDPEANSIAQVRLDAGAVGNAFYMYTVLYSGFSVSASADNNRIECIDHNRVVSGIKFPPTQIPSNDVNTLDDYEEGQFTPSVIGSTSAGTGTYSTQWGSYTKIGRQVTVQLHIVWSAHTGTGNLKIGGLPFTAIGATNNGYACCSIGLLNNIALSANNVATGYVLNSSTEIDMTQYPIGGGAATAIPIDAAGGVMLSVTYFSA